MVDLSKMKDDELKSLADSIDDVIELPEQEEAVEESTEPEPEETTSGQEEAEAVVEEVEEEQAESTEEPVPTDTDLLKLEIERLKAQAEEREHYRRAHDKLSGEYSKVISKLRDLETRRTTDDSAGYDTADDSRIARLEGQIEQLLKRQEAARRDEASRALAEEAEAFKARYPDVKDYAEDIKAYLAENYSGVEEAMESSDPDRVRDLSRSLMREAYFNARDKAIRSRIAAAEESKAKKSQTLKERKLAASASTTGGARTATRKTPKTLKDLSDKELAALAEDAASW